MTKFSTSYFVFARKHFSHLPEDPFPLPTPVLPPPEPPTLLELAGMGYRHCCAETAGGRIHNLIVMAPVGGGVVIAGVATALATCATLGPLQFQGIAQTAGIRIKKLWTHTCK